jgi:hypothetical protein
MLRAGLEDKKLHSGIVKCGNWAYNHAEYSIIGKSFDAIREEIKDLQASGNIKWLIIHLQSGA